MSHSLALQQETNRPATVTAATRAPQKITPTPVSSCACGGGCPRCNGVRAADPPATGGAAPAQTPAAPAQAASVAPKFLSGELAIADSGTTVTPNNNSIPAGRSWDVDSPFKVSTSGVKIEEPPTGLFEYGLVQNLFFHHIEARYEPSGDLLADAVGPLLDVWPGDPVPFFHEGDNNPNPSSPGLFGSAPSVQASYSDKPGVPLRAFATACNKQVPLKQAKSSVVFRAGVVARNTQKPAELFQLATTTSTFGLWWELNVDEPGDDALAYHITKSPLMKGPLALSPSAPALKLDGTVAVTEINARLKEEKKDLETRCESVLDPPPLPLP